MKPMTAFFFGKLCQFVYIPWNIPLLFLLSFYFVNVLYYIYDENIAMTDLSTVMHYSISTL